MVSHQNSSSGMRFLTKIQMWGSLCLQVCGCANFSTGFLQSIFMKILNSLQFQTIGLIQAKQLLTSETWLIKTF